MEKQPSFNTIIGGTKQQREELQDYALERSQESGEELFGEYLVQPTEHERKTIQEAVKYANDIALSYGSKRKIDSKRIFILKPRSVKELTKGELKNAKANSIQQSIAVDRVESDAILAKTIVHEVFHLSSYQSAQISTSGKDKPYRDGIEMVGRQQEEGSYFSVAQEALIAILSKRFFDDVISKDPLYGEDLRNTPMIKAWLSAYVEKRTINENEKREIQEEIENTLIFPQTQKLCEELNKVGEDDDKKFKFFQNHYAETDLSTLQRERTEEVRMFDKVLDDIMLKSNGLISDRQKLFDEFARAHFSGNYVPLARMIEDILGQGSFRKIAIELGQVDTTVPKA